MAADHTVSQSMAPSVFGKAHSARDQHVMVASACLVPHLSLALYKVLSTAAFESDVRSACLYSTTSAAFLFLYTHGHAVTREA